MKITNSIISDITRFCHLRNRIPTQELTNYLLTSFPSEMKEIDLMIYTIEKPLKFMFIPDENSPLQ